MATNLGSKLITKQMNRLANMTERNHLGMNLHLKPHLMEGVMNQLFTSRVYAKNPLSAMLMGNKGTDITINGTDWEWRLKGANKQPLVIIEDVTGGATTAGQYNTKFKIKLNENWFSYGDVLNPGSDNKKYQVRVAKNPVADGDGYIYEVEMMTKDQTAFIPAKYLAVGQQWFKLFSQYGEGSKQGGSIQFGQDIALKNSMSLFRKQYSITDYAATEVLAVGVLGSNGKSYTSWMQYAEVEYWKQWYEELEAAMWYTRSTDVVLDNTGRPVQSGPGIQEQLEDGHQATYSVLTATLIEEFLMDIFYGRVAPGQGRSVKAFTGEYGMIQFHRAVQDWMNKSGFIKSVDVTQAPLLQKTSSPYHKNALAAGYQIVKYMMANGSELELIHNPLYDSRDYNSEIDPVTGYPVASQRFTFIDFSGDGESNIKLMNKEKGYHFWYVQGGIGPLGPLNGGLGANGDLSYEMHVAKSCGVHIGDVSKTGELILSRE